MATGEIDLNNLDKSDWKAYRFDEIVQNISERVDPNNTDLKVYVGLEHLDSESLHIKRFGTPDDVNGQKLKFYKGDIIFGRRRAYQRKAGIATTDGFCSAHALVLRANPDVIDPQLLPFFLHSDLFMHRAVDISVGSLSPTINWGTLKHQDFLIPPKYKQSGLAKLLLSNEACVASSDVVLKKLLITKTVALKEFFKKKIKEKQIKDFGEIVTGSTPSTKNTSYWGGDVQFVTPADIFDKSAYITKTERYITKKGAELSREIPPNSVMVVCIASVGKIAISTEFCVTNQQINTIIPASTVDSSYLYNVLSIFNSKIVSRAANSVVPILNKGDFGLIKIPNLPDDIKLHFISKVKLFDITITNARDVSENYKTLMKSLINKVF
ncbi:MAG: restriction endonuclease subunit S [Gammaproteobacteria bacterium]|jgi:restriction endonuclease S subunit|nr:restriction endonuclease subunit S [Gammaproteobacteria bacterium]MBT6549769.1 restriction endonuclease subunit S [Gammaproteobacteria bacterium]MBT6703752.1 restriction endonuclease subunit S [Gammaproteobacteria bacterium]